jgi:hypothetical protein
MTVRLLAVPLALIVLALGPATAEATSRVTGDFDGDGHDDLAVGVPGEDVGSVENAGAVNVIYGSASGGLTADGNQLWHQDSTGIADAAEPGDIFGSSLAAGDFDGDGRDDLAIGVPAEDVGSVANAGAVNVLYGAEAGLRARANQLWHQNRPGIDDAAEPGDFFGSSLAAGDFNGSGHDDLAVGAPLEDVGAVVDAGAVSVIYGSDIDLRADGNRLRHQDSDGIADEAEPGDRFGSSLTAGDFDGEDHDDLAVGAPFEDVGSAVDAGAVSVLYGSAGRLGAGGNQLWHQDSAGIEDAAEAGDFFGSSLAAGEFDRSGHDDLAVGVPREDDRSVTDAGAVNVIYGAGDGLRARGNQLWTQDNLGRLHDFDERFGFSLAAGDFDGDRFDDLAGGVPGEGFPGEKTGAVSVLYGSASRLSAAGNQFWNQDSAGIEESSGEGDRFGAALTAGDHDGSGQDDLAVGVPGERPTVGFGGSAGAVNVIYGAALGLSADGNQLWHQDSPGIEDAAELLDNFGLSLPT